MYIGRQRRRRSPLLSCLLTLLILAGGVYVVSLILAYRGIYILPTTPSTSLLPQSLQPTPTPTDLPTEPAVNHFVRGQDFFKNGKLDQAIAEFKLATSLEPKNDAAFALYARALTLRYRSKQAIEAARYAAELKPTAENVASLANALDWASIYDEALAQALRAIQLDPKNANGYSYLAEIYADLNRLDKALAAANQAIELDKDNFAARRNLGYVYESSGNYSRAVTEYRNAIKMAPNFAYLYVNLARNYRIQGQNKEAIATLEQALKFDPGAVDAYDELGWTYFFSGETDEAIAQLKLALKANPEFGPAYGHIGVAYFSKQDWENTASNLQRAIDMGGSRTEYFYELALAYINLNRCDDAQPWVAKALLLAPDDDAVQAANGYYNAHCLGTVLTPTPRGKATAAPTRRP